MTTYKHILVPTDFSKSSGLAASRGKNLADNLNAKLTVLHVVNYVPPGYMSAILPATLANEDALVDMARIYLENWLKQENLSGCGQIISSGSPKTEIVKAANEHSADLIVMGAHNQAELMGLIGSTTNAVIHHAPCDVLTTRLQPSSI